VLPQDGQWNLFKGSEELVRVSPKTNEACEALEVLIGLLDGRYDRSSIISTLIQHGVREMTVRKLLDYFEANQLLEECVDTALVPDVRAERQLTFLSHFSTDGGHQLQTILKDSKISVICSEGFDGVLLRQLSEAGIGHVHLFHVDREADSTYMLRDSLSPACRVTVSNLDRSNFEQVYADDLLPNLFLVGLDTHDPDLLGKVERFSFERNVPWCPVQITSPRELCVGPIFLPRDSACYSCMEGRRLSNLSLPNEYLALRNHLESQHQSSRPIGGLAPVFEVAAGIVVVEIVKFLTKFSVPQLVGRFLALDTLTWQTEIHDVLRLPQCRCRTGQPTHFPWKEASYAKRQGPRS
jgi:bacteriocin biosynthesis cyclodehydratase domain-containing protein